MYVAAINLLICYQYAIDMLLMIVCTYEAKRSVAAIRLFIMPIVTFTLHAYSIAMVSLMLQASMRGRD
jgi:hypothetical protein